MQGMPGRGAAFPVRSLMHNRFMCLVIVEPILRQNLWPILQHVVRPLPSGQHSPSRGQQCSAPSLLLLQSKGRSVRATLLCRLAIDMAEGRGLFLVGKCSRRPLVTDEAVRGLGVS